MSYQGGKVHHHHRRRHLFYQCRFRPDCGAERTPCVRHLDKSICQIHTSILNDDISCDSIEMCLFYMFYTEVDLTLRSLVVQVIVSNVANQWARLLYRIFVVPRLVRYFISFGQLVGVRRCVNKARFTSNSF